MKQVRMQFAVALFCLCAAAPALAQEFAVIPGNPLKIHVGADGSFQIFNAAVPGVGQVYPTTSNLADMGVFANINGSLFAPNFRGRGTATGSLGNYTAWTTNSFSTTPTGIGTAGSPYTVAISLSAPGTSVSLNMLVTYVNGNNFFRVRSRFSTGGVVRPTVDAFLGADIYLASSDSGLFISVPELAAVGGTNCNPEDGDYNILLIPITPAQRFTADQYAEVWRQIGTGELANETGESTFCIDNGAALQWENIFEQGTSVDLNTAVSFGAIPDPANFHGFSVRVEPDDFTLLPGQSQDITVKVRTNAELGFNAPITLTPSAVPIGMTVELDETQIPAPGNGTVTGTVSVQQAIFPQVYSNIGIVGTGGGETRAGFFNVEILCTPPIILGINQPQSVTVLSGESATLEVRPEGEGLFLHQWYNNHWPLTGSPVGDGVSAVLETGPVTQTQYYWARVTNPCGSVDSRTAVVNPQ